MLVRGTDRSIAQVGDQLWIYDSTLEAGSTKAEHAEADGRDLTVDELLRSKQLEAQKRRPCRVQSSRCG